MRIYAPGTDTFSSNDLISQISYAIDCEKIIPRLPPTYSIPDAIGAIELDRLAVRAAIAHQRVVVIVADTLGVSSSLGCEIDTTRIF